MRKRQIIRISITLTILLLFLTGISWFRTKELTPTVSFLQECAQVDTPLVVSCDHYPPRTSFTYTWYVGDNIVATGTDSYTPSYNDLENFISVRVTSDDGTESQTATMYFSKLPVLYINTDDGGPIYSNEYYFSGSMRTQGNSIYTSSNSDLYSGIIDIKGRGNSTYHASKMPYKLKLETEANLFQMGYSKHWVLLSNPYDDSFMRNKIAYDLSGQLGMTYMESTWVDVILNGQYVGNYQLCEQIRIGEDRVDITDWTLYADYIVDIMLDANAISYSEVEALKNQLKYHLEWITTGVVEFGGHTYDLSPYLKLPEQVNGGFICELDAFYDEPSKFMVHNQPIQISRPKFIGTNSTVMEYAYNFVNSFYEAVYFSEDFSKEFYGNELHYTEMFDVESLAKYFVMTEIFFNEDAGLKSTYFYKDQDCLAEMGPIWDMDYSSGGQGTNSSIYDQWQTVFYSNYSQDNQFYKGLIKDPYFLSQSLKVWEEYHETILNLVAEDGPIKTAYKYILESALADNNVWPVIKNIDEHTTIFYDFYMGYDTFLSWMQNRLSWLTSQFTSLDNLVDSIGAFNAGTGVTLTRNECSSTVTVEAGEYAVFYFNGIRQTQIFIENHKAVWFYPPEAQTDSSDVILVRVYSEDGILIGSDYIDFR